MVTFFCRKFLWATSIALLIPSLSLTAQTHKYALTDYIDSAERHLPELLQKKALVAAAKAGVMDAHHSFLPDSWLGDEVTAGTDNSIPGSYVSFGIIPSSSSGVRSSNLYQAALGNIAFLYNEYELVDFGLKNATIRYAEGGLHLSQADFDREAYLIKWRVGKLYLDILKNEFQLGVDQENVGRYETLYKVIRAVTSSGIKPGADSALAMAELSKTRITYNQTDGQVRELKDELSYLTGIPADFVNVDTARNQAYLAMTDILSLADSSGRLNPLTDYYEKEKSLYLLDEGLVKKSFLPKILLTGVLWGRGSSFDYQDNIKNDAFSGLGYQRFNYMAGITLQYNLFNIVHRRDKEAIIHSDVIASDYGLQQQVLSLQNVGNKADQAIRTALKNLQEVPIQIQSAQDAYNQKTAQYRAGIINLVDLTNSSFILYRSQTDYVQTLSDWLAANLDKSASTGSLDQFIQYIK